MTVEAAPPVVVMIRCPRCRRRIEVASIATSPHAECPSCRRSFEAVRFEPPAPVAVAPQTIGTTLTESQPCAAHPLNAAVTSCQRCGSFMCSLCRIDVDKRTLCPSCFERLSAEGSLESTRTTFRDFPGLAGITATAGCVMMVFGVLFGPLAIYYGIKGVKQKRAMGESDGIVGLWAAIVLGGIECAVGIFFAATLIKGMFRGL
jgi:uncharacterized paraquat-inducible protein A